MVFTPISMMRIALLAVAASSSLVVASEEDMKYCSSQNTGSSFSANVSTYQSYGLCEETCNADYAFAILQAHDCWCSNYAPSDTTDTSNCSTSCPGYSSDMCGNLSEDLFSYYEMSNVAPSGTITASSSTTASKTSKGESTVISAVPETETVTVTASDSKPSTIVTASSSSSTSTFSPSTETSSTATGATTTKPTLSVETVAGQAVTVTVGNPTSTGTTSADSSTHHSSLSGGAIAGIVIGSLAGVGILLALLFWFCYARRRSGSSTGSYDSSIQGNLLDGRRHSKGSQMSMMRNIPSSPGGGPTFTDSRMNKEATLYPNGARLSNVSLQDNQDYSRPVLRLTNPD